MSRDDLPSDRVLEILHALKTTIEQEGKPVTEFVPGNDKVRQLIVYTGLPDPLVRSEIEELWDAGFMVESLNPLFVGSSEKPAANFYRAYWIPAEPHRAIQWERGLVDSIGKSSTSHLDYLPPPDSKAVAGVTTKKDKPATVEEINYMWDNGWDMVLQEGPTQGRLLYRMYWKGIADTVQIIKDGQG